MRSTIKAAGIMTGALAVTVPTGLVAATLVGSVDPVSLEMEGMGYLLRWGAWVVVVCSGLLEVVGWREELERPFEWGWVWGGITIILCLGLELEVLAGGFPPFQKLVAITVGVGVVLVLTCSSWTAGRPVVQTRKRLEVVFLPNQPETWSPLRDPGRQSHFTF